MGRKADPKGKDRPRTIVLAGDVAEIAQKLADKGELSRTLSELLRFNYGFGDALDEKKRELEAAHEQRINLQRLEESLALEIDDLESTILKQNSTIKPNLEKRKAILLQRRADVGVKLNRAFAKQDETKYIIQARNLDELINEVNQELEELN